jgi:integrase
MAGVGFQTFWHSDFDDDARGREALRAATGAKERATKGEEIMARRKTFQQGTVVERKYEYGTAFILRYRIRKLDGGWQEKSETLSDCSSKKAALKVLSMRLQSINEKNGRMGSHQTERKFGDLLGSKWSRYLDNQSVKASTRYAYGSVLKKWIKPFFGELLFEDIGAETVGRFMAHLAQKQLSAKYRRNVYNLLKVLFEIAIEYDLMPTSPIRPRVHRPEADRRRLPVFTLEQMLAIIEHSEPRYRPVLETLGLTGLRAGELLALRWKDCDFKNRRFTILNTVWRGELQTTKTEASDRTIGMPEPLVRTLTAHQEESKFTGADDFVFCQADGRPIDPDSLRRFGIYPALDKAGIPFQKRASGCHAFRRFVASMIHKQTGSLKLAQQQHGHSTLSTTADIYTAVDEEQVAQTADALGKAFCGRSVVETPCISNSVN